VADIPKGKFKFSTLSSVGFGVGSRRIVGQKAKEIGRNRVMLLTVPELLEKSNLIGDIRDSLGRKLKVVFSGVKLHVPRSCVMEGANKATESSVDHLISLGGSSTTDAAKGINLIIPEGNFENFFAKIDSQNGSLVHRFDKLKLPHIAMPTSNPEANLPRIWELPIRFGKEKMFTGMIV
jgi:alcohol dehydrogenase class IV